MWPLRRLLLALATTLLSLLSMVAAIVATDFGAGWAFFFLLAVPLTLGLPTTLMVLMVTALWPGGPPLWLFALLCVGAGTALQFCAFALLAQWRRRA
jgi:hypothetical protein